MKKSWQKRGITPNRSSERGNLAWRDWCRAVTEQVRFKPDRAAIEQELLAHLEDGAADFERIGYTTAEAEKRALDAMGSAFLVGSALDQAHHPFLGWLWQATRVLLLVLALTAAVTLCFADGFSETVRRTRNELRWEEPPTSAASAVTEHAALYAAPGDVREEEGHVTADIQLWIEMRDPLTAGTAPQTWYFTYRDDQGELTQYSRNEMNGTWPESRYWQYVYPEDGEPLNGWFRLRQTIRLTLDQQPQWVEITYPTGGAGWTLRIEWGDGA